jgi:hypothetical protein
MSQSPLPVFTVLVGAEGAAEVESEGWVRPATDEEKQAFIAQAFASDDERYRAAAVDRTGRPYFLLTVLSNAPKKALEKAHGFARYLRLTE